MTTATEPSDAPDYSPPPPLRCRSETRAWVWVWWLRELLELGLKARLLRIWSSFTASSYRRAQHGLLAVIGELGVKPFVQRLHEVEITCASGPVW